MSDDDQLGLLLLHQLGDSVRSGPDEGWLLLGLHLLALLTLSLGLGQLLQTLLLSQSRLGPILLQQLERLDGGGLVQGLGELMDWWWHLQTLLENGLLALDADVLGPSNETRQIALGLNVLT